VAYEELDHPIRVVDLFSGGGGLSLGVAEAARRAGRGTTIAIAVEIDDRAADVYALNFPKADLRRTDVSTLFDGPLGSRATTSERALSRAIGHVDVLVAGPPCQGHSDLNNHTRRKDSRNVLYLRAIRAAEILRPTYLLVENVPTVQHDKGRVVELAVAALEGSGYRVGLDVLDLVKFGVPQRRRRHILLAVHGRQVDPQDILETKSPCSDHAVRSVRWAISDLLAATAETGLDSPSRPTAENLKRMEWLHAAPDRTDLPNRLRPECHRDKKHSYVSMYGRLSWDEPAQTITTGFGSTGQGRFVHPELARTITPHEAARLQTLPDFYDLDESKGRGAWAKVIGNAVPPLLGVHLFEPLLLALPTLEKEVAATVREASSRRRNGTPPASGDVVRLRMQATRRRYMDPELALRSQLHGLGLRFQVNRPIGGNRHKTGIVFPTERVAVYVDECFWHSCPDHGTTPKANTQFWRDKLAANRARDVATTAAMEAEGWLVLRFWEHDDVAGAARAVYDRLQAIRSSRDGNGNGGKIH
jgi:DNA (cytosine-5)-methyltransferase 1